MDDAILLDGAELADAVRIWSGWGTSRVPSRDDARILAQFETSEAESLLAIIGRLEEDFYASDAYRTAPDLTSMVERATADFRRLHPDVSDEIVRILAWCYSSDSH
jgi:hypothetical protein